MNTTAFRLHHWKAVMRAGLEKYRIGRHDDGAGAAERPGAPRIHVALPAVGGDPSKATGCHNRLMMLCEMSLQTHSGAIEARESRKRKMDDRGPAGGAAPSRARMSAASGARGGAPVGAAGLGQQRAAPSEQPSSPPRGAEGPSRHASAPGASSRPRGGPARPSMAPRGGRAPGAW
ncbi:unnamed protein product [Prorocentrum cordatum]|uniref:Uncharacterized protein n=1 Tax=Prorocentrum cordatum TaxID=2364126 RepID=A0ABN9XX15_9DINO|nr:unnamed protein product [Polarella glacialis]